MPNKPTLVVGGTYPQNVFTDTAGNPFPAFVDGTTIWTIQYQCVQILTGPDTGYFGPMTYSVQRWPTYGDSGIGYTLVYGYATANEGTGPGTWEGHDITQVVDTKIETIMDKDATHMWMLENTSLLNEFFTGDLVLSTLNKDGDTVGSDSYWGGTRTVVHTWEGCEFIAATRTYGSDIYILMARESGGSFYADLVKYVPSSNTAITVLSFNIQDLNNMGTADAPASDGGYFSPFLSVSRYFLPFGPLDWEAVSDTTEVWETPLASGSLGPVQPVGYNRCINGAMYGYTIRAFHNCLHIYGMGIDDGESPYWQYYHKDGDPAEFAAPTYEAGGMFPLDNTLLDQSQYAVMVLPFHSGTLAAGVTPNTEEENLGLHLGPAAHDLHVSLQGNSSYGAKNDQPTPYFPLYDKESGEWRAGFHRNMDVYIEVG